MPYDLFVNVCILTASQSAYSFKHASIKHALIIDLILSLRRQSENKALSQTTRSHYKLNSLILMLALQVKTSRSFERDGNRLLHRHTLNELSEGGDNKARGLHSFILKWDFVITTVILQHVFECTHRSSVTHHVPIMYPPTIR